MKEKDKKNTKGMINVDTLFYYNYYICIEISKAKHNEWVSDYAWVGTRL